MSHNHNYTKWNSTPYLKTQDNQFHKLLHKIVISTIKKLLMNLQVLNNM